MLNEIISVLSSVFGNPLGFLGRNLMIKGFREDQSEVNDSDASLTSSILPPFIASINPETISLTKSVSFNEQNEKNAEGKGTYQHQGADLDKLSFDLILDGTGITTDTSVSMQISTLTAVCCGIDGVIHKPLYLCVFYGDILFKGHLESLKIDYNLFDTNGLALRAKASLSFVEYKSPEADVRDRNPNSPDMSHLKVFREGDSLPSMCENIYGDMKYYIAVARINKLTNFRDIEVGTGLLFPPLI